jgi:hypothetical protein
VVDEGLLFWILVDFWAIFWVGIEGKGFWLYSKTWAGSLGVYEACGTVRGTASDLGGMETNSQSSESVGDGEGTEISSAGS